MTRTTLLRRTILQFEQILFTDDLTFMILNTLLYGHGMPCPYYFNLNVMRPLLKS